MRNSHSLDSFRALLMLTDRFGVETPLLTASISLSASTSSSSFLVLDSVARSGVCGSRWSRQGVVPTVIAVPPHGSIRTGEFNVDVAAATPWTVKPLVVHFLPVGT